MNSKLTQQQRSEIIRRTEAIKHQLEIKFLPSLRIVLKKQVDKFLNDFKNHGLDFARHELNASIHNQGIKNILTQLLKDGGVAFAFETRRHLKQMEGRKAGGRMGINPDWISRILQYLNSDLLSEAVLYYSTSAKNFIQGILDNGANAGLSYDELSNLISKSDFPFWKGSQITRTELGRSAILGREAALQEIDYQTSKEWIAVSDSRTREDHADADGQIVDQDQDFIVGGVSMSAPCAAGAPPEQVISCRCVCADVPKRSSNGQLIMKR